MTIVIINNNIIDKTCMRCTIKYLRSIPPVKKKGNPTKKKFWERKPGRSWLNNQVLYLPNNNPTKKKVGIKVINLDKLDLFNNSAKVNV